MDWLIIWTVLISVMALLGWLACSYFWWYYSLFKHLAWACLVLLVGFLSYNFGIDKGAWVARDAHFGPLQAAADGLSSGSSVAQEGAKVPFLDCSMVIGFLMYCVLMLLIGGQLVNNSAKRATPKVSGREGLLDADSRTLNR